MAFFDAQVSMRQSLTDLKQQRATYTVPSAILMQLPATRGGNGTASVVSASPPTANNGLFTAPVMPSGAADPLTSVDYGVFLRSIGSSSAHISYTK